jgi:hypothetical protein
VDACHNIGLREVHKSTFITDWNRDLCHSQKLFLASWNPFLKISDISVFITKIYQASNVSFHSKTHALLFYAEDSRFYKCSSSYINPVKPST